MAKQISNGQFRKMALLGDEAAELGMLDRDNDGAEIDSQNGSLHKAWFDGMTPAAFLAATTEKTLKSMMRAAFNASDEHEILEGSEFGGIENQYVVCFGDDAYQALKIKATARAVTSLETRRVQGRSAARRAMAFEEIHNLKRQLDEARENAQNWNDAIAGGDKSEEAFRKARQAKRSVKAIMEALQNVSNEAASA
jgi:hypothetical protein